MTHESGCAVRRCGDNELSGINRSQSPASKPGGSQHVSIEIFRLKLDSCLFQQVARRRHRRVLSGSQVIDAPIGLGILNAFRSD
jgi:hypothetical protein